MRAISCQAFKSKFSKHNTFGKTSPLIYFNLIKMGLFLKKGVEIDAFTDIVDSKNGLSERIQVSLTAVCADLPAALHKQHKNVDVTEMQLQFTWQFDAAYSHMTTH